jgi:hypothetical protein
MVTVVASSSIQYDVPDEWWYFCGLDTWHPQGEYYPSLDLNDDGVDVVALADIQPMTRDLGDGSPFRKYKLVPVLFRFQSPECLLPAIDLVPVYGAAPYRYRIKNGFHRYAASLIVGYKSIPARIEADS